LISSSLQRQFAGQLEYAIEEYTKFRSHARHDDLSGESKSETFRIMSLARAAVQRITGRSSEYMRQIDEIQADKHLAWEGPRLQAVAGVAQSLLYDLQHGHLKTVAELLHGEVFADFLEMAQHLLQQGYKDAAAIVAGAALESHLRRLAEANGIDVFADAESALPKKADRLNADLAKAEIYGKLDQKSVTAWLDLRNKATHGQYETYERNQVDLLVAGIRDFLTRLPA
jgi:uncharacterized protein (DUF2164 family)